MSARIKLSVSLHAPLVTVPYKTPHSAGTLHIDMGDFTISNRFFHGYQVHDTKGSVVELDSAQAILDRIEIKSSSIQIYRNSTNVGVAKGVVVRNDILDTLEFVAVVTRNLSAGQTLLFPLVTVKLDLEDPIKVGCVAM